MVGRKTRSSATSGSPAGRRTRRSQPDAPPADTASDTTEILADQGEWGVRSIQSKQVDLNGRVKYLVDWEGWSGPPTWEPEENCKDCQGAINAFEQAISRRHGSRSTTPQGNSKSNNNGNRSTRRSGQTSGYRRGSNGSDRSDSPSGRGQSKSFKRTPDKTYGYGGTTRSTSRR